MVFPGVNRAHDQPQQTTEWENRPVANPKDNFITTIWDDWWAIILVEIYHGNEGKSLVFGAVSQWILYSTTPIRQQIRASKPWRILKLNFPQRNKGNSLWKRSYRHGFGMGHFFQQILLSWLEYIWMFYTYSLPASTRHYVDSIIGDAFICKHCKLHVDIHFTYEYTGP